ncbi:hypothetical protein QQ045_025756 [Rhodiola kirilowii]
MPYQQPRIGQYKYPEKVQIFLISTNLFTQQVYMSVKETENSRREEALKVVHHLRQRYNFGRNPTLEFKGISIEFTGSSLQDADEAAIKREIKRWAKDVVAAAVAAACL